MVYYSSHYLVIFLPRAGAPLVEDLAVESNVLSGVDLGVVRLLVELLQRVDICNRPATDKLQLPGKIHDKKTDNIG